LVVGGDASDVVALTGARGAQGRRLLRRRSSGGEFVLRRRPPDGVEVRHRNAPLRQAATWIFRRNLLEHRRRLGVGEGMQKRQAALEGRLNLRLARGRKADLAELLWRDMHVVMFVLGECPARHERQGSRHELAGTEGPHGSSLRQKAGHSVTIAPCRYRQLAQCGATFAAPPRCGRCMNTITRLAARNANASKRKLLLNARSRACPPMRWFSTASAAPWGSKSRAPGPCSSSVLCSAASEPYASTWLVMKVKFCFTCRESMVLIHAVPIEAPSSRVRLKRAVPPGRCAGGSEATPSTVSGMKPNPVPMARTKSGKATWAVVTSAVRCAVSHRLVRDESDQRDGGNDGKDEDGPVLEPVVAVSFLEYVLQGDHADGQERDAESVDGGAVGNEGRLLDLRPRDPGGDEAQGNVDEEDPMPAGPLHQVSADRGAEQRSGDRSHGEEGAGHSVLLFRIAREEHALRSRDGRPATQTLEDAEADERGQVPGQAAERACCREDEDRGRVIAPEAEAPQQPS